jgi:hypothetical protein
MDEAARNEKDGAGLSLEAKEEVLGGNNYENSSSSTPEAATEAEVKVSSSSTEDQTDTPEAKVVEVEAGTGNLVLNAEEDAVLGQLVADLGDKRIYLATVPQLIRIPVRNCILRGRRLLLGARVIS